LQLSSKTSSIHEPLHGDMIVIQWGALDQRSRRAPRKYLSGQITERN